MHKKALLLLALLLILNGCSQPPLDQPVEQQDPPGAAWVTIYLVQGEYLVPVTVRRDEADTLPRQAIDALLEWNAPEWAVSLFPVTTEIHDVRQEGDLVIVDFSSETMSGFTGGTLGESLLLQSLIWTMTSLEGIERVQVLVDGHIEEAAFGHADTAKPLVRPAALNVEQAKTAENMGYLRLWFMDPQAMFAVPVSRPVPTDRINYRSALDELLKGPEAGSTLLSPFPEGTAIRSITHENKTCTVDFSQEFVSNYPGGSALERMILQSLVLTLTEFDDIEEVVLTVEGEGGETLLGHVFTAEPLVLDYPNPFN